MTINEFVREEKEKLNRFIDYWISNHLKDPEQFPLDIPEENSGTWIEMYNSFEN